MILPNPSGFSLKKKKIEKKKKEEVRAAGEDVCLEHAKSQVKVFFLPFILPYV